MQRVLSNEPVINTEIFSHILPLLGPKHAGGPAPLDHMDDTILSVSNKLLFFFSFTICPSRAMTACRSDV